MNKGKNVYLMYLIVFLQGLVFYGAIATIYRESRGVSISGIYIIEAVYFILTIIMEVPWGWFADRFGYKRTLVISNILFFLSKIVFWKASGFLLFLFERVLLAASLSGLSGCDSALLFESLGEGENSEKVFGRYDFFASLGFLIASMSSVFIVGKSMDLSAFLTVIPYGIASILTFFLVDVKKEDVKRIAIMSNFVKVLKDSRLLLFLLAVAVMDEVVQSITVFLNQNQYVKCGIDIKYFGIILTGLCVVKLISARSYKVSAKLGQKRAVILSGVFIALCVGCMAFTSSWIITLVLMVILTGASEIMHPMVTDMKNKSIDQAERATMLSIYSMTGSIMSAIINPVIGGAADISLEGGILMCCGLAVFSVVLFSVGKIKEA